MFQRISKEQVQNETSYYSPSHQDLLGHLGNPAILEYQELPKIVHNCICVNLFNSIWQRRGQQKPIHEQMPIMTFYKSWSYTGNGADALSTKPCFQTWAVLRLWKADRSVGECDTYCLARESWGSFNKHPLEKERENVGYSSIIWSTHKSTDYGENGDEGLDHSQKRLWV